MPQQFKSKYHKLLRRKNNQPKTFKYPPFSIRNRQRYSPKGPQRPYKAFRYNRNLFLIVIYIQNIHKGNCRNENKYR